MKKLISVLLVLVTILLCFTSCGSSTSSTNNTPTTVNVSSVSLSQTELNMLVGEKTSISATVSPSNATNKNVTWSSSNSAVADYVNGNIVALGEGNCIIKATSSNGKVAACTVKVEKASVLAESVSFPKEIIYLGVGDSEKYVKLNVLPETLDSYKGTVVSSNNSIVTANYSQDKNLKVTFNAKSAGNAKITVTLDGGETAEIDVVVIDPSELVKINLPSLPLTVSKIYFCDYPYYNRTVSSGRIDSIDVNFTMVDQNTVAVIITINGTKTYDENGYDGHNYIDYYIDLYKENDVFCERKNMAVFDISIGQTFTNVYKFNVAIDDEMTPREFKIEFSSSRT